MISFGCGGGTISAQQVVTVEADDGTAANGWIAGAPVHTRLLVGSDGQTYIGVWVEAPHDAVQVAERAPMAVSLVIDTSGSMAGDKIANARMAAASLLETLADGDIVSVYGFSNGVLEYAPPTVLNPGSRAALMQRVQGIEAGGGTNMWDGLQVGASRMREAPGSHPVRRVIMISDGHANIGPSDPMSLGNLAAGATEWGTQVTAIGVGLDYDEQTLGSLAVRSSGRLYHLEQPYQMASILEQELLLLSRTVAVNSYIEVVPAPGVVILEGLSMGATVDNNRLRVSLGSVYAGQEREVLFRAQVDTGHRGSRELATARFVYERPGATGRAVAQAIPLRYEVTADASAATQSLQPRVHAMVANHEATRAQLQASQLLNQGRGDEAAVALQQAQRHMEEAAAAAPAAPSSTALRERAHRFEQQSQRARAARSPAAGRAAALDFADDAMEAEGF